MPAARGNCGYLGENATIIFVMALEVFHIEGIVQKGDGKGKELGFPTANIPCADSVPSGIYAGEVIWKGIPYPAAVYKEDGKGVVEAHLLDFSGDLYGETLKVIAHTRVRDAKVFPNEKELIAAIKKDIENIRKYSNEKAGIIRPTVL